MSESIGTERIINTVCMDHCTNTCFLRMHVKDGKITRVETDKGPMPQHRACLMGRAHRQLVYHPDRLLYPMKRVGERGEGKFKRIDWDEALETVASELKRIRGTYGARSTIFLNSVADGGYLHEGGLIHALLVKIGGYTGVVGTVSDQATRFASLSTYGTDCLAAGSSRDTLAKSRMVIFWGFDPMVSRCCNGHMPSTIKAVRDSGARIISVDPRYTTTAAFCGAEWIPIRPTTDAAMMVAMAHVILKENLQDQAFMDKYTLGWDAYKRYIFGQEDGIEKTPRWASEICGVPAETIARLAREYAATKPAALQDGLAPARTANGEQFNRAAAALCCMTGNLGKMGGSSGCGPMQFADPRMKLVLLFGVHVDMKAEANPVNLGAPYRKNALQYYEEKRKGFPSLPDPGHFYVGGPSDAYLYRTMVPDAILRGKAGGYPADYKALYVMTCNFVNTYANSNKSIEALKNLEFMVCHEQFMTATAKCADIILPQNTFLERQDVTGLGFYGFYGFRSKVIEPRGESRSPFEIAKGLAAKLGISNYTDKTEDEWLQHASKSFDIPDYEKFKKDARHLVGVASVVAFEKEIADPEAHPFPTPSGKVEIYSQRLADMNDPSLPPVPKYIELWEGPGDPLTQKYPLQLITCQSLRRVHSRFDQVPWLRELEPHAILINSADAEARGIMHGDMVKVFNDRGTTLIAANVSENIMPGVVDIPVGAWINKDKDGVDHAGACAVLLNDQASPGGGFCSNTALVQVEKLEGRANR
jgi:anaerobic dimethyl sulfoxide reductase subunit A